VLSILSGDSWHEERLSGTETERWIHAIAYSLGRKSAAMLSFQYASKRRGQMRKRLESRCECRMVLLREPWSGRWSEPGNIQTEHESVPSDRAIGWQANLHGRRRSRVFVGCHKLLCLVAFLEILGFDLQCPVNDLVAMVDHWPLILIILTARKWRDCQKWSSSRPGDIR
jgi:hypothetical protein